MSATRARQSRTQTPSVESGDRRGAVRLPRGVRAAPFPRHSEHAHAAPSPSSETLLARIERAGPAALDDHELLGLVGIDIDAATLAAAGGLRELLDDPDDTLRLFLMPAEHRARAHAVLELHARWLESRLRRDSALTAPNLTRRYFEARLRGFRNEVFVAIFLDSRHRPIAYEELFNGTVDGATLHPRVVVRRALMHNAAALVVAHGHTLG